MADTHLCSNGSVREFGAGGRGPRDVKSRIKEEGSRKRKHWSLAG